MNTVGEDTAFGPMQLIVVSFEPTIDFVSDIIEEIDNLRGRDVLRLLDVLVLMMDEDGMLTRVEIADEDFGNLLILDSRLDPHDLPGMFAGHDLHLLQSQRVRALTDSLVPGGGLALILVEHRWARSLFATITGLGGVVLSDGFLGERVEELVSVQIEALEETALIVEAASIAQSEAVRATVESAATIVDARHRVEDAKAAASVTAAELKVLRYLPTEMNFALVADRLGISRSAAKQRAERAYTKLGVHTRAEAVARARQLGLIRH